MALGMTSDNVRTAVRQMTLAQKVGQMVMVDFSGYVLTDALRRYLADNQWGGVVLFAKNVQARDQVRELAADLQRAARDGGVAAPLFVAIDQEGGIVNRLAFPETPVSPGNMALGATGRDDFACETARIYGQDLASLGINLNFAPCVDVNNNPFNPIIGVRSFGEDPQLVSRLGLQAARGYRDAGCIPTAKHFPGHGDTSVDSHLDLPTLHHPMERLEQVELVPFRALIEDGIETIMTAHITYPALEPQPGLPATLSRRILTDFLRGQLGFGGVVITDSMAMQAVARNFGVGQAAVMAVQAGADVVLACGPREAQVETLEALIKAVERGDVAAAEVDAAVERILDLKERFMARPVPPPPGPEAHERMRQVARASVTLVKDERRMLPLAKSRRVLVVAPTHLPASPLGEMTVPLPLGAILRRMGMDVVEHPYSLQDAAPDLEGMRAQANVCDAVVACLFARNRLAVGHVEMAYALQAADRPLAVVAVNSPYVLMDVPFADAYLCTYGYTRPSLEALADVLTGAVRPQGRLPVSIPGLYAAGHRLEL